MSRKAQHFRSRLLGIVDDSLRFHHYFALIKSLETRKEEAEDRLATLKSQLTQSRDQSSATVIAGQMAAAYRRWYGLSK